VHVVWHQGGGGVTLGAAEVLVAIWAAFEAQWWEERVLVAELWNADRGGYALPVSVAVQMTDTLRTRVRAAATWLGEFELASVTLGGADVRLLTAAPQDIARRLGATAVDKSTLGKAVTVHGSQLDGETSVMLEQAAVVVTAAMCMKVTAPGSEGTLVTVEVAL
jgi:hypothetical protein